MLLQIPNLHAVVHNILRLYPTTTRNYDVRVTIKGTWLNPK